MLEMDDYRVGILFDVAERLISMLPSDDEAGAFPNIKASLKANAGQLLGLIIVPYHFVQVSMIVSQLASQSALESSQKRTLDPTELTGRETHAASKIFQRKWQDGMEDAKSGRTKQTPKQKVWMQRTYTRIVHQLANEARWGFEGILSAIAVNAWALFEVLATDLWEEALNRRAKPLAIAAINNQTRRTDDEFTDSSNSGKMQKLKFIQTLIEDESDAVAKPGTILRKSQKFHFDSLAGIRDAYRCVFGDATERLFKSPWFSGLEVAEGVRNVLIHRGGKVDARLLARIKSNSAVYTRFGLASVKRDSRVPIDGTIIAKLVKSSVRSSLALLHFVENWFSDHPDKLSQIGENA